MMYDVHDFQRRQRRTRNVHEYSISLWHFVALRGIVILAKARK